MITKDHLLHAIVDECLICQHLFTKLPEKTFEYRPSEGQRSGLELLQYMSFAFAGVAHAIVEGNWEWYSKAELFANQMDGTDFPQAMSAQIDELKSLFSGLSDETLSRQKVVGLPWPNPNVVGVELLLNCYRWIVGYKMQLFLYAKACGAEELSTLDCWFGNQMWKSEE